MGASFGAFRTTLVFGQAQLKLQQMAVSGSLEYRLSQAWTIQFAAGGAFNGQLGETMLGGGGVASVAASWLVLEQANWWPFVQFSGSVSFSAIAAQPSLYSAFDARLGVVAGYTIFDRVTPYLTARAFGGPVFYAGQTGTDLYHYQFGLGLVVALPLGFDLSAEFVPLGEQRVTGAVGYSF